MPKKILVVDDDPDVRLFNASVVEDLGYLLVEASNGEEGQLLVAQEVPDLIILDVMMPRLDGWEVLRALKADPSERFQSATSFRTALNQILTQPILEVTHPRSQAIPVAKIPAAAMP